MIDGFPAFPRRRFFSRAGIAALAVMTLAPAEGAGLPTGMWVLQSLDAAAQSAPGGVVLQLSRGVASGSDGCNQIRGRYRATAAGFIEFTGSFATTMMACPQAQMDFARAYTQALSQARRFRLSGDGLQLIDGAGQAVATYTAQPSGLAGTRWTATGHNNGRGGVVSTANTQMLKLEFGANGALTGSVGCASFTGRYAMNERTGRLAFTGLPANICPGDEATAQQAREFIAALQRVVRYQRVGARLNLRSSAGSTQANLTQE